MKCPKCDYVSFDYLRECKKCGEILDGSRKSLNLKLLEPTLFTNFNIQETEQQSNNEVKAESAITSPESTDGQQSASGILTDNEFFPAPETKSEPAVEIESHNESSLELGGLGSMNAIQQRPEFKVDDSAAKIELDTHQNSDIDGLELSSPFTENSDHQKTDIKVSDLEEIDIDNLDLFAKSADPELKSTDHSEDDIPLEFVTNDSETDPGLKTSDTKSGNTLDSFSDGGAIELELDMNDDESLDELLAGLENKK